MAETYISKQSQAEGVLGSPRSLRRLVMTVLGGVQKKDKSLKTKKIVIARTEGPWQSKPQKEIPVFIQDRYRACALIPTYNHHLALKESVSWLKNVGLDILIVDDGSGLETQKSLRALSQNMPGVHLLTLPFNQGKGAAVQAGLHWLAEEGYTHAFQIDADGQHSLENIQDFLDLSRRNPHALLSGQPIYDESMPLARRIGRWVTHVWVWIETLSLRITDSMCGYRIYPIEKTLSILQRGIVGSRMDFDTEIMVRLFWEGTPVLMSPVRVSYPEGNSSNFDVLRDNWRITKMHTRLFFGMLKNLRAVLFDRPDYKNLDLPGHDVCWASMGERGSLLGLLFLASVYRLLGKRVCLVMGMPIVFYFYITGIRQRKASQTFLKRVFTLKGIQKNPGLRDGFRHFMNFLEMALDKFAAWTGHMDLNQIEEEGLESFQKLMESGQGGLLLVSHLGNMEFCRAVSCSAHKSRLHLLMHTKNAKQFNRILTLFNPHANVNVIEVSEIGPDTLIYLKSRINTGDWVVMAADRVPVKESSRVSYVPFLGKEAPFSQGPYVLASLLECPVYTALAVREDSKFRVFIELFAEKVILQRKNREENLKQYSVKYAAYLERYCIRYPYHWFNFFDFWAESL